MGCPACELPEPTEVVEIIAGLEGERDAWQDMANTERLLRFADSWVAIGYAAYLKQRTAGFTNIVADSGWIDTNVNPVTE